MSFDYLVGRDRFAWSFRERISFLHRYFCVFMLVAPVMLPPGRFRLATTPNSTGSLPIEKTIGIVVVAAFAASAAGPVAGTDSELDAVGNTGGLLGVRV